MAWQVDEFNARRQGQAVLQISSLDGRLPAEQELVLYRVTQEALTNVARHAHARNIAISLARHADGTTLDIQDDGTGFDVNAIKAGHGGLGLSGMRERLALVGGDLVIDSAPGRGTRIRACVPAVQAGAQHE
jgi:two-component system, NarL family, sensor histidine kinase UhpB